MVRRRSGLRFGPILDETREPPARDTATPPMADAGVGYRAVQEARALAESQNAKTVIKPIRISANGDDAPRLPTERPFASIEYNSSNEIDWAEWSDFDKLTARDVILLIHGLNPNAYRGGVPSRVRQDQEALDIFRKVKHWLDVVGSETVDSKTAREWLAWADRKQLTVHSEFRAMVASKTAPTDAMPESKTAIKLSPAESATDNRPPTTDRGNAELHDSQQNAVAAEHAQTRIDDGFTPMKRESLVEQFTFYSGLANALRAGDPAFVECRVPNEVAPGKKRGYYYVEKIERACIARWGKQPSPSATSLAPPLRRIRDGKNSEG